MSKERELKILLTKDQYETLLHHYPFEPAFRQINTYYDANDFLKNQQRALRIREIGDQTLVTLKLPLDSITKDEFEFPVTANSFKELKPEELTSISSYIPDKDQLKPIARIETIRSNLQTDQGTFSLDRNTFDHHSDYELEYEYKKDHDGFKVLNNFLKIIGISYHKNCPSKLARAMEYQS